MKKCAHFRDQFSAYLDGAVTGAAMHEIAAHLEVCSGCEAEFAQWRDAQSLISSLGPAKAPANLGLRLRVALSQEAANTAQEKFARGRVRWQNRLSPLVWQVTAGFASTVALLGGVALLIGMFASPEPLLARDEPLGAASSPRFLYSALEPAGALQMATIRWLCKRLSTEKAGSTTTGLSPETRITRPACSWKILCPSAYLPRRRCLDSRYGVRCSSPSQEFQ